MTFADTLIANEGLIRLAIFAGGLSALVVAQELWPRRVVDAPVLPRWTGNAGILIISVLMARLLGPLVPVSAAIWAGHAGVGLFQAIPVPAVAAGVACFVLLDLLIYFQHRVFHAVPVLWRVHRMHHSDIAFDVTTALRFHPFEIVLSQLVKAAAVVALGAPAVAVLIFEAALNLAAMFNHSNIALPAPADKLLRRLIVTPDMHRVHHSVTPTETNSNFGFLIPWWDRIFSTYRDQPAQGHEGMTIGLEDFREARDSWPLRLFVQPFRTGKG